MSSVVKYLKKNSDVFLLILWSALVNCSLGALFKPFYIATNVLLIMMLSNICRWLTVVIVLAFSILSIVLFPIIATYGKLNVNMVTAILYANHEETLTTIKNLHFTWVIFGLITLAIGLKIIKQTKEPTILKRKTKVIFTLFCLMVIFIRPTVTFTQRGFMYEIKYPPFASIAKIYDSIMLVRNTNLTISKSKLTASSFSPKNTYNKKYNTYIMVIGESVRRDYMNVYGAPMDNTPYLSSSPGVFFDNYVSASFATVPSLTHSLVKNINNNPEYNNSVVLLAKSAGLKTFWISNQGFYGFFDSPVAIVGTQADHSSFIKIGNSHLNDYMPDTLLIPEIKKALSVQEDKLITIHLIGSHIDFCTRVNDHYKYKLYDKKHSCYAQSIENTDHLLETITSIANQYGDKWSMLYFSDHGLSHSYFTGELTYSDKNKQNYSPPFARLNYDDKEKIHIKAFRSGLDFEKMFSQWIGIDEPTLRVACNYFTESKCLDNPKVYNGDLKMINFNLLSNDPPRYY